MTLKKFDEQIARITDDGLMELYVSPDFQCDQTGGFPTSLCCCWGKGKAWLVLNEFMMEQEEELTLREQCADFGIRNCYDAEDFNNILFELGRDAIDIAWLYEADEG